MTQPTDKERIERAWKDRRRREEKLKRDIERGVIKGQIFDGRILEYTYPLVPKYSLKELQVLVRKAFSLQERRNGIRRCYLGGGFTKQLKGVWLKRLLKSTPEFGYGRENHWHHRARINFIYERNINNET